MPQVIYVEGLIGAGKSTLLKTIENYTSPTKVRVIYEPVKVWEQSGILKMFYDDPKRWAYTFQTYVCISRIQSILNFITGISKEDYTNLDIIYVERSVFSDKYFFMKTLFEAGMVSDVEMSMYNMWWDMWRKTLPQEFTMGYSFLYVKPHMDTVMKRVRSRARDGEESVSETYQTDLARVHDEFFQNPTRRIRSTSPEIGCDDTTRNLLTDVEFHSGRTTTNDRFIQLDCNSDMTDNDVLAMALNNIFKYF